jgi:tRNA A37 N6-isopentenylltransferase MiaA
MSLMDVCQESDLNQIFSDLSSLECEELKKELLKLKNIEEKDIKNKSIVEILNVMNVDDYYKILIEFLVKLRRFEVVIKFSSFYSNYKKTENKVADKKFKYLNLKLNPYDFQYYLAQKGIEGVNNIICLRTGAGKTLISAIICKHWFLKYEAENRLDEFKVAFIVPTRHLAEQQCNAFKQQAFDSKYLIDIDEKKSSEKIAEYYKSYNIIFLTGEALFIFIIIIILIINFKI